MFSKSIDQIMKTFNKAISDLELHSTKHDALAENINDKISDLLTERDKHLGESSEATRLAEKLKQAFA